MDGFIRKGMYLATEDEAAIDIIRKRYGLSTDSDAVRFALRLVADPEAVKVTVKESKTKKAPRR